MRPISGEPEARRLRTHKETSPPKNTQNKLLYMKKTDYRVQSENTQALDSEQFNSLASQFFSQLILIIILITLPGVLSVTRRSLVHLYPIH